MEEKVNERARESAEEVLARLERYVETHRDLRVVALPTLAPSPVPAVDTLIPSRIPSRIASREETPRRRRRFASEVAPALITVTICSFVIFLSEWFDPAFAVVVAAALMLVGVVGLVRRVPLARAYTFGLVVAALLVRFS